MRRRATTTILVLSLAGFGCREAPRRPVNILLITIDTFRADRIGAGTPTLARLGRQGIRFDAADSPVPLTLPAHASLMSGLWPLHHGLRNNGVGGVRFHPTLPRVDGPQSATRPGARNGSGHEIVRIRPFFKPSHERSPPYS